MSENHLFQRLRKRWRFAAIALAATAISFVIGTLLPGNQPALQATADTGFDVCGAAAVTGNLYDSYQDNGGWEMQDSWNLLAYVPFAGMTKGVKQTLGATRKVKGGTFGPNKVLKEGPGSTGTSVAGGVGNDNETPLFIDFFHGSSRKSLEQRDPGITRN